MTRWASGADFQSVPMRYQMDPDNSFLAALSNFREHGAALSGVGNYSLIVKPSEEISPQIWVQDEIFLYVIVRNARNHGQTVCIGALPPLELTRYAPAHHKSSATLLSCSFGSRRKQQSRQPNPCQLSGRTRQSGLCDHREGGTNDEAQEAAPGARTSIAGNDD